MTGSNVDRISAQWFDPQQVQVIAPPELQDLHAHDDLVRLSGAPSRSTLTVSATATGQVELKVANAELFSEPMVRLLVQDETALAFDVVNVTCVLAKKYLGRGIGTRLVAVGLNQARILGYRSVIATSEGNWSVFKGPKASRGYETWPMQGFDAAVPRAVKARPGYRDFSGCERILQLLDTRRGEQFWLMNGQGSKLSFDLQSSSPSWERHAGYTHARGIEVLA